HLYIAIAKTSAEKYLFVNVTTRRAKSDLSCVLQPNTEGVPNFVKRESVINYLDAREMNVEQLARVICVGSRIPKCRFSSAVLSQIQQGGIVSKRLPKVYKNALRKFLGVS
ncbi:MAG: hypothetical protein ACK556_10805, partial [Pseudanabaena sp.]